MASIAEGGNPIGATRASVSTIIRPDDHGKRTVSKKPSYQPYSSIALDSPLQDQPSHLDRRRGPARKNERSFSSTLEVGGQFVCVHDDSVGELETGATANLVCFKWLGNHNSHLQKTGILQVRTYPTMARFRYGDGRNGEVRFAAEIKVGIAGRKGAFTAPMLEADIQALLRKGAHGALGGHLESARDVSAVRNHGVDIPHKVNETGRYVLSVVALGKGPPCVDRGPSWAAS